MADALAFWLIPTHETRGWFEEQIRALAERYKSPVFEPHVTVHVGPEHRLASPASLLAESSFEFGPLTLATLGTAHSDVFTKTVYVEFSQDAELLNLSAKLRERLPSDYVLNPHLSLAYAAIPSAERAEIVRSFNPPRDVRFEVMQAVQCPMPTLTANDVRSWRILEEWRL